MSTCKIIDITQPFENGKNITIKLQKNLPFYMGYECYAHDLNIISHTGTYFETSSHLYRHGKNTDDIPPEKFFLEATIIKLNQSGAITRQELEEKADNLIKEDDALLIYSKDNSRYFSYDAAHWMVEKKIALLGATLRCYDTGFINPTGMFIEIFNANIPIIANLINLDLISKKRVKLFVFPLKVKNVCIVPCRAIIIEE